MEELERLANEAGSVARQIYYGTDWLLPREYPDDGHDRINGIQEYVDEIRGHLDDMQTVLQEIEDRINDEANREGGPSWHQKSEPPTSQPTSDS